MDGASVCPDPHPFYLKRRKAQLEIFVVTGTAAFNRCLNSLAISLCLGPCRPASVCPSLPPYLLGAAQLPLLGGSLKVTSHVAASCPGVDMSKIVDARPQR